MLIGQGCCCCGCMLTTPCRDPDHSHTFDKVGAHGPRQEGGVGVSLRLPALAVLSASTKRHQACYRRRHRLLPIPRSAYMAY